MRHISLVSLLICLGLAGCHRHVGCVGKRASEKHCPTDIRKTHCWCFGEDAIFHCPCGPDEEYYGHQPTLWREWPASAAEWREMFGAWPGMAAPCGGPAGWIEPFHGQLPPEPFEHHPVDAPLMIRPAEPPHEYIEPAAALEVVPATPPAHWSEPAEDSAPPDRELVEPAAALQAVPSTPPTDSSQRVEDSSVPPNPFHPQSASAHVPLQSAPLVRGAAPSFLRWNAPAALERPDADHSGSPAAEAPQQESPEGDEARSTANAKVQATIEFSRQLSLPPQGTSFLEADVPAQEIARRAAAAQPPSRR